MKAAYISTSQEEDFETLINNWIGENPSAKVMRLDHKVTLKGNSLHFSCLISYTGGSDENKTTKPVDLSPLTQ